MWWLAGSRTKVNASDFRGGIRHSKMGKKIRSIPKSLLNHTEKRTVYKALEKRGKEGGSLSKSEVEGTLRQLLKDKSDNISKSEVVHLRDHLEDVTGYEGLRWSGHLAEKYSNFDEGKKTSDIKAAPKITKTNETTNPPSAPQTEEEPKSIWKKMLLPGAAKSKKEDATKDNSSVNQPKVKSSGSNNKSLWSKMIGSGFGSKTKKEDGNKKETETNSDLDRLRNYNSYFSKSYAQNEEERGSAELITRRENRQKELEKPNNKPLPPTTKTN